MFPVFDAAGVDAGGVAARFVVAGVSTGRAALSARAAGAGGFARGVAAEPLLVAALLAVPLFVAGVVFAEAAAFAFGADAEAGVVDTGGCADDAGDVAPDADAEFGAGATPVVPSVGAGALAGADAADNVAAAGCVAFAVPVDGAGVAVWLLPPRLITTSSTASASAPAANGNHVGRPVLAVAVSAVTSADAFSG